MIMRHPSSCVESLSAALAVQRIYIPRVYFSVSFLGVWLELVLESDLVPKKKQEFDCTLFFHWFDSVWWISDKGFRSMEQAGSVLPLNVKCKEYH